MRRASVTIPAFLLLVGLSTACGSDPTAPAAANNALAFVGMWQNIDAQTNSIPQIAISMQGNQVLVHVWGACLPTYCDWGQAAAQLANGALSVTWQFGFQVDTQMLTTSGGQLHSALHVHFTDGSGRPDYDSADVFNKVS